MPHVCGKEIGRTPRLFCYSLLLERPYRLRLDETDDKKTDAVKERGRWAWTALFVSDARGVQADGPHCRRRSDQEEGSAKETEEKCRILPSTVRVVVFLLGIDHNTTDDPPPVHFRIAVVFPLPVERKWG